MKRNDEPLKILDVLTAMRIHFPEATIDTSNTSATGKERGQTLTDGVKKVANGTIEKYYPPKGKGPAGIYLEGNPQQLKAWPTDKAGHSLLPSGIGIGAEIEFDVKQDGEYNGKPQYLAENVRLTKPAQAQTSSSGDLMRSKSQCMRGEALQAAASFLRGVEQSLGDVMDAADTFYKWIEQGPAEDLPETFNAPSANDVVGMKIDYDDPPDDDIPF